MHCLCGSASQIGLDVIPGAFGQGGITGRSPLNDWVRQHEVGAGVRDGVSSDERARIKDLEREVKELRKANEILKLASAFFAQAELDRRLKS